MTIKDEITLDRNSSLKRRKKLGEITKKFKEMLSKLPIYDSNTKKDDKDNRTGIILNKLSETKMKTVIKSYQNEIDMLTKRSTKYELLSLDNEKEKNELIEQNVLLNNKMIKLNNNNNNNNDVLKEKNNIIIDLKKLNEESKKKNNILSKEMVNFQTDLELFKKDNLELKKKLIS